MKVNTEWTHYLSDGAAGAIVDREGMKKWGHTRKRSYQVTIIDTLESGIIQGSSLFKTLENLGDKLHHDQVIAAGDEGGVTPQA